MLETPMRSADDTAAPDWPPSTLKDWNFVAPDMPRLGIGGARSLWNPLEAFFTEQGYSLFVLDRQTSYQVPRNSTQVRSRDPYHVFVGEAGPSRFICTTNKLCAASRLDGTHVVIQLLAIGEDGLDEVQMMQRLHLNPINTDFRNRCVPLLDLMTYEPAKMVFGVFPMLFTGYRAPRPQRVRDALETCRQILESIAYIHSNLVAHLDIGPYEFLINVGDPFDSDFIKARTAWLATKIDFFELFDFQWSITDFNLSIMYDPDSDVTTRKVVGLCNGRLHIPPMTYEKMLGPEVWRDGFDKPYCPFKHDVYQISKLLQAWLPQIFEEFEDLQILFDKMASEHPNDRPAVNDALESLRTLTSSLTQYDRDRELPIVSAGYEPEHLTFAQFAKKNIPRAQAPPLQAANAAVSRGSESTGAGIQ